MTEPDALLGALSSTADDVTHWAEDDEAELLVGEDADSELDEEDEDGQLV